MDVPSQILPTVTATTAKYRGNASSHDYNVFFRSAYNDLVTAYQVLQQNLQEASLANEILLGEYNALASQVTALEAQLVSLQNSYQSLRSPASVTSSGPASAGTVSMSQSLYSAGVLYGGFPSYYPDNATLPPEQRADYEPRYSQILPHFSVPALSKTYVVDLLTRQSVFPPGVLSVSNTVTTPSQPPFLIEENDSSLAVDGDETTYYRRNTYFSKATNIQEAEVTFTLTVPEQFVNDLTCNYVTIHPYPEFEIDISSVTLNSLPNIPSQQLLPQDGAGNIQPIVGAGKTRLLFPDIPVVSVAITMRQSSPNTTLKPGLQAFVCGASVLDVGYLTFSQSPSKVLVPFQLSSNFFQYITHIGPTVPGVGYQLYFQTNSGDIQPANVGDSLPGLVSKVYVEITLTPVLGLLPVVEQIQIQFVPLYRT